MNYSAGNTTHARARLIAFYLPQFHPIPENDEWWGKGFTEWTNVSQARSLFRKHNQPRFPTHLGYYDLRLPESRNIQAELAYNYGIEGFCYWHYWFNGKRLLERPFQEVLTTGQPDFPFCLAWANESWSRRWLGEEKDILQEQTYDPADDTNHVRCLLPAFADPRYIRVAGRPLFLVYRPRHHIQPQKMTEIFRKVCIEAGLPEPYILGMDAHCPGFDCSTIGFDGNVNFEPQLGYLPDASNDSVNLSKLKRNISFGLINGKLKIYDYSEARRRMMIHRPHFPYYPTIFVGWDNSPRRGANGIIILNSRPDAFAEGLNSLVQESQVKPFDDRLIFINAWNEWAEGNYLEPDVTNGTGYLEKIRECVSYD